MARAILAHFPCRPLPVFIFPASPFPTRYFSVISPPFKDPYKKNSLFDTVTLFWGLPALFVAPSDPPFKDACHKKPICRHKKPICCHPMPLPMPGVFIPRCFSGSHRTHGLTRVEYHNPSQTTRSTPTWLHSASIIAMPPPGHRRPTPRFRIFLTSDQLISERARPSPSFRLQRHDHAIAIRNQYLAFDPPPFKNVSCHRVPPRLRSMVNHANHQLRSRHSDVTIDARCLWRVLVRQYSQPLTYPPGTPNHNALYFFGRAPQRDEQGPRTYMIRRKDPSNTILPASATLPYNNCTFITQPKGMTILYVARGLHFRHHGTADASSIPAHISDLEYMSIPSTVIRHPPQISRRICDVCHSSAERLDPRPHGKSA